MSDSLSISTTSPSSHPQPFPVFRGDLPLESLLQLRSSSISASGEILTLILTYDIMKIHFERTLHSFSLLVDLYYLLYCFTDSLHPINAVDHHPVRASSGNQDAVEIILRHCLGKYQ